jgi:hypothetical protein
MLAEPPVLTQRRCKKCKKVLCYAGDGVIEIMSAGVKYSIHSDSMNVRCCNTVQVVGAINFISAKTAI